MPIVRGYSKMLRRNLLYTGITRAKNFLVLCGELDTLAYGLQRDDDVKRLTTLKERVLGVSGASATVPEEMREQEAGLTEPDAVERVTLPIRTEKEVQKLNKKEHSTDQLISLLDEQEQAQLLPILSGETVELFHPLIGMEGISPYDFLEPSENS